VLKKTSIYISTFPNALASKGAQNHEISTYFSTNSIVAFVTHYIIRKFKMTKMLWFQTFQPPSHANLEVLKNKPRKTWPKPGDFKNMRQIKSTTTDCLFQSTLCLISALCCTRLLLFSHLGSFSCRECLGAPATLWWWGGLWAHQDSHGWRLSLALPPFPSQISFDELYSAVLSTDFSIFLHTFRNYLAI